MRGIRTHALGGCLLLVAFQALTVLAQKPPQLGYMYPPVLKVGATQEVKLGGYDFTPDLQWFFHTTAAEFREVSPPGDYVVTPPPYWTGPRMSVGNPLIAREVQARIEVSDKAQEGINYFQTANANGISQTAAFLIRSGKVVVENRWRDDTQELENLPIGVSGRLSRLTEVDRYRFEALHDGLLCVELYARRLGSNFNAMLKIEDEDKQAVVDVADTLGTDCRVVFPVRRGVTYTVSLHDVDFRGDASFVYHLEVHDRPVVERCHPAFLTRGSRTEVELIGWGLASGGAQLESIKHVIETPADVEESVWKQMINTAVGQVEINLPIREETGPLVNAVPGELVEGAFELSGIFEDSEKEQHYRWKIPANTSWKIKVEALQFGGALDLELGLLNAEGKLLLASEDSIGNTDPSLNYHNDSEGELTLVIRRLTQLEDENANRYFLSVSPQVSDFELKMEQSIPIALGAKKELTVKVERSGDFDAEIALDLIGLPEGVTVQGEKRIASGKNEAKLVLEVSPTAKVIASPLRVSGEATIDGKVVRRDAVAMISKSLAPLKLPDMQVADSLLSITMAPPFDIFLLDKTRQRDTPRGATCVAEMDVVRKEGYEGEVFIEMAAQQSRYLCGSYGLSLRVPADVQRVVYGAWMSEWLGTEYTMRMATHGVAKVADPHGNFRYLIKATDAPITMIMEGALLKVSTERAIVSARLGERLELPVKVSRSPKLSMSVAIQADIPPEVQDQIQAVGVTLAAEEEVGRLVLELPRDQRLLGKWSVPIRAVSEFADWPVQAFCEVEVRVSP